MDSLQRGDGSQAIVTRSNEVATTTELNRELPGFHAPGDDWDTYITPRHVQWIGAEERLIRTSEDGRHHDLGPDSATTAGPSIIPIHYYENKDTESEYDSSAIGDNEYEFSRLPSLSTASSRPIAYDGSNGLLQRQLSNAISGTSPAIKVSEKTGFVPRGQLDFIMGEEAVAKELTRINRSFKKRLQFWKSIPKPQTIKQQAQVICGCSTPCGSVVGKQEPEPKSYRKVFATLLLIERPGTIGNFVQEGVCDADLPLIPQKIGPKHFSLCRKEDPGGRLKCFEGWRRTTLEQFGQLQWKTLAPFFTQSEKGKVQHQSLENDAVLPFTYRKYERGGAHGDVFKVQIHPEHHNFRSHQGTDVFFAVKKIRGEEKDFQQEVRMLKRLRHRHLISLLATYQHGGHFHLIFPWAKCDLLEYWKDKNREPAHDSTTLVWMARQCKGIAEGLAHVHHHKTNSVSSLFDSPPRGNAMVPQSPSPRRASPQRRQTHLVFGRHGDIKPKNLLWFPNSSDSSDMGTIKISDFGTGEFSTTDALSASGSVPHSPQYRPPECDLPDYDESGSSYDIWTLGCLYLEFITWYMGGYMLLEELETVRRQTTSRIRRTSAYFELLGDQDEVAEPVGARVKLVVEEFIDQKLRRDPEFSTFLDELLDLIQKYMLIVEPRPGEVGQRRISCGNVYRHLGQMINKFEENSESMG